jgi:hypothetical protein
MGSLKKKWPASGAWLGAAPVLTVRDSGGAGRGDSAVGDRISVRRRVDFFVEQRGREKGRGKWGSRPGRAEEGGGGSNVRAEWGPGRQWRAPGGGGRRSGAVV